jgi:hypothetical protein
MRRRYLQTLSSKFSGMDLSQSSALLPARRLYTEDASLPGFLEIRGLGGWEPSRNQAVTEYGKESPIAHETSILETEIDFPYSIFF